ncbi:BLOC-1-related complex subunit 6 [Diaphorina citri]|uniref:BLOC-1-related complex subunit 6 n=1 Tax=Diaphorina citri TaxID=121845 RepID=A0A3Q0IWJ6_DIACI|nr:BLOC-1-related complex subunit 6 [Diaphorina citri]
MTTPTNSTNPFAPSVSTPLCSPNRSPLTENPELDEDMMREMTASYSEISQSCSSIEDDKTEKGRISFLPNLTHLPLPPDPNLLLCKYAITVECLETYRDSVSKTCEIQDANIKAMYQLMAKCEQLAISIQPVQKLAQQVKEVRRLIDLFEDACNL